MRAALRDVIAGCLTPRVSEGPSQQWYHPTLFGGRIGIATEAGTLICKKMIYMGPGSHTTTNPCTTVADALRCNAACAAS